MYSPCIFIFCSSIFCIACFNCFFYWLSFWTPKHEERPIQSNYQEVATKRCFCQFIGEIFRCEHWIWIFEILFEDFCEREVCEMILITEAATRGVLCEKVFLEISQNSQENTCARVSFLIKKGLQLYFKKRLWHRPATLLKKRLWHRPATLLKRCSGTGVFLRILWNF